VTLYNKANFPYESVLRTGYLGGRGRLGAAAPVARHVLGGRRQQRRPRVACRRRACGRRPRTSGCHRGAASRLGGADTPSLSQRRTGRAQEV